MTKEFHDHVADLLAPLGAIGLRSMFGGAGVYCRGVMFGLIAGDVLYFKVDEANRGDYEQAGAQPFSYESGRGKRVVMSYFEVPARLFEERPSLLDWAAKALDAALRARQPRTERRRVAVRR
jgi:DNA transformation protein